MATSDEVQKLGALARVSVSEEELPKFTAEFDAILRYVGQLDSLALPQDPKDENPPLRNVFRPDGEPHATGAYTDKLAAAFRDREGDALSVKQIITHE